MTLSPADSKQRIFDLFHDLVQAETLDPEKVADYLDPDYQQRVDGVLLDYQGFIAHMHRQKEAIARVEVEFLCLVAEGNVVFSNHQVHALTRDGRRVVVKVIAQFELKQGRLLRCDELTRLVSGTQEDEDLGSRH
ncbi:nuclear transport factor 2 family protein [Metapseudomonas furukawaii]|mgnify:CR=1 FL=1|uniref:SnoaL-like domain-containing protein n=1 Tax=Metapseudomonas furukawaii TaxID=1149133 RepID=A0AAD1C0Q3_METFU|nr:nuclear transport factor 2 family protein [Pseudomonas furukawaii]ELS25872.1 hypothetical protein ppKF707_4802 [Pseudomonas furukawaii]BAU74690.1 hypothetical protein KF707C_30020 [Pseudomonas furukawaii]